jgi:hypothetical protein
MTKSSAQLHAFISNQSLHYSAKPMSPANQPFTVHSLLPGTVLIKDICHLKCLGIERATARRRTEDTVLAMANYFQQDEGRWIHKLTSISK